jgi:pimeloyl-ACP methyl ester carboxylesterase
LAAQEAALPVNSVGASLLRIPNKTLGGDQYWADEFIHGSWRIQRNVFSGHYRLLDDNDYRRAFGDYLTCYACFEKLRAEAPLPNRKKEAVVLLHGLLRSRDTMQPLANYLAAHTDWEVVNFTYPSSRATVSEHAETLDTMLNRLRGVETIHFVGHSLGNIVVRHWMHDQVAAGRRLDLRVGRFVMLGPPNQGAQMAEYFRDNPAFTILMGKSGKDLSHRWESLDKKLCIPPCDFGIMAGNGGVNPLIDGADDLCVAVEETKLPGAADFRVLPLNHSTLRTDETVHRLTLEFLRNGYFESEEQRQPLLSEKR